MSNSDTYVTKDPIELGFKEALTASDTGFCQITRKRTQRIIEHIVFRLLTILLILLDLIIVICDVADPKPVYEYIGIVIVSIFAVEVSLRIFCLGVTVFFTNWIMVIDFVVIAVTFIVTIVVAAVTDNNAANFTKLIVIFRLIRLPRLVVLIRVFLTERKNLSQASRKLVSQNKQRYRDDGFDLDLCYITDKIIAMSFPSSGLMALYRNPIREVARFLDTKHPDKYKVYNLCRERCYDPSFFHGRVKRVLIDDHNVPELKDMVLYAKDVQEWMAKDPNNIIVVHCKGGKGRTGTMICTYMVDSEMYSSAKECLEFFGRKRTDYLIGGKFQGVETPSQNRYVGYFEIVKKKFNYEMPPDVPLKIVEIIIHGISKIGNGDGTDFWFQVYEKTQLVFECDIGTNKNCDSEKPANSSCLKVKLRNPPTVTNDVKFRFYSRNKNVPAAYEKCAFFFWFYTYFIEDNKLKLTRADLDNPHKEKTWTTWHEDFSVELLFENV